MDSVCCRLCGYNSQDLIEIFSDQGIFADYAQKISRYLYLLVTPNDDLPKAICWMCSEQLDSFHRFHEKINEIQRRTLKDRYLEYVIEAHSKYVVEGDIEIIEHAEHSEKALPNSSSLVSEANAEYHPDEEEEEAETDEELTLRLIPDEKGENSFLVVKTEMEGKILEPDEVANSPISIVNVYAANDDEIEIQTNATMDDQISGEDDEVLDKPTNHQKLTRKMKKTGQDTRNKKNRRESPNQRKDEEQHCVKSANMNENFEEPISEGESDDDFPARDSDNEEWPTAETMDKFPTTLIKDGLLVVKGTLLMKMVNRFYNLQCDLCKDKQVRFKHLSELYTHYETTHKVPGYVNCCQAQFRRYPSIIMHMARHIQPDAFKCDICGYMVTRPRFLQSHRQTHLPEDEKPYGCAHCTKRFCWKRALQIHENSHKAPNERIVYTCSICRKKYDTPGGLSAHKRNAHSESTPSKVPHVCEICANSFATSSGLREHIRTIHQHREKCLLQCPECSRWLMNSRCLKIHMQLHRKEDFACELCDYRTKKAALLKRHHITHHQQERPFACDECEKTFKHKRALTIHKGAKHTGQNTKFKCNFCDRIFNSSTNFYTHRKNRHPIELAALKEQAEAEKKLKRIRAGIEADDVPLAEESTITTVDGTRIITINSRNYSMSEPMSTMIVLDITEGKNTNEESHDT